MDDDRKLEQLLAARVRQEAGRSKRYWHCWSHVQTYAACTRWLTWWSRAFSGAPEPDAIQAAARGWSHSQAVFETASTSNSPAHNLGPDASTIRSPHPCVQGHVWSISGPGAAAPPWTTSPAKCRARRPRSRPRSLWRVSDDRRDAAPCWTFRDEVCRLDTGYLAAIGTNAGEASVVHSARFVEDG